LLGANTQSYAAMSSPVHMFGAFIG